MLIRILPVSPGGGPKEAMPARTTRAATHSSHHAAWRASAEAGASHIWHRSPSSMGTEHTLRAVTNISKPAGTPRRDASTWRQRLPAIGTVQLVPEGATAPRRAFGSTTAVAPMGAKEAPTGALEIGGETEDQGGSECHRRMQRTHPQPGDSRTGSAGPARGAIRRSPISRESPLHPQRRHARRRQPARTPRRGWQGQQAAAEAQHECPIYLWLQAGHHTSPWTFPSHV